MGLNEIIQSRAKVTLAVTASDLADFAEDLVERTRRSIEKEIAENQSEIYYSKEQVCRILNVQPSTLWTWDKRDYLKPIKVGRANRYRKSDIDRIVTGKSNKK